MARKRKKTLFFDAAADKRVEEAVATPEAGVEDCAFCKAEYEAACRFYDAPERRGEKIRTEFTGKKTRDSAEYRCLDCGHTAWVLVER